MNIQSIQTPAGFFTIAAFDHRGTLAKTFNLDPQAAATAKFLSELKTLFMVTFSPICSGVLVDPLYGFPAIASKAKNTGLILPLESSGYTDDHASIPNMIPNWGVLNIKNNYAVAKLLVYYHPAEANAEAKLKIVMELCEYCHQQDISFLVEPIVYNPAGATELTAEEFTEAQLNVVQDLQPYCDVLKLQYPGNALAAATITAALDIPWILLSRGMPYEQFAEALRVCMENGAKGFAAGRAVWQEISKILTPEGQPNMPKINEFLQTTGKERMQGLIEIVQKKGV